jgi:hypothetical protein
MLNGEQNKYKNLGIKEVPRMGIQQNKRFESIES